MEIHLGFHSFARDLLFWADEYGIHSISYNPVTNLWNVAIGNFERGEKVTYHIYCIEDVDA